MHMPRRGIINKRTVDTLKKIYTRPNRAETSDTYTTTFPALKFYKHLAGKVDSIRIHENYKTGPAYFVKNDYVGRGKTYTCLCLYKCPPNPRQIRGLSSVLPASALIEMAKNQKTKTRVTSYEQTLK
jgi:hypothetical protein